MWMPSKSKKRLADDRAAPNSARACGGKSVSDDVSSATLVAERACGVDRCERGAGKRGADVLVGGGGEHARKALELRVRARQEQERFFGQEPVGVGGRAAHLGIGADPDIGLTHRFVGRP
jgi:hypothetical protein